MSAKLSFQRGNIIWRDIQFTRACLQYRSLFRPNRYMYTYMYVYVYVYVYEYVYVYVCVYTYIYIYMYVCVCVYIYAYIYYKYEYIYIYIYQHTRVYPPTPPERRVCETTPPSLEHPSLSKSDPSKQGPAEDISRAAEIEESYPPDTQAAGIKGWVPACWNQGTLSSYLLLKGQHSVATGHHSLPQAAKLLLPDSSKSP